MVVRVEVARFRAAVVVDADTRSACVTYRTSDHPAPAVFIGSVSDVKRMVRFNIAAAAAAALLDIIDDSMDESSTRGEPVLRTM